MLGKLIRLCRPTDEMFGDALALAELIQRPFSGEFAFKIDDATRLITIANSKK
jgi:hypothetical protein